MLGRHINDGTSFNSTGLKSGKTPPKCPAIVLIVFIAFMNYSRPGPASGSLHLSLMSTPYFPVNFSAASVNGSLSSTLHPSSTSGGN